MLKLYDFPTSGNCYKVHLLLGQLGRAYERVEVPRDGGTGAPEFLALNPLGKVPVLELAPGRVLTESAAILHYLADGTAFMPADAFTRAEAVRWMMFEQQHIMPTLAFARYQIAILGGPAETRQAVAAAQAGGRVALGHMEAHLAGRDWFAGERYSVADTALYAYTHAAEAGEVSLAPYGAVRAWHDRVRALPGYVELGKPPG